MAGDEARSTGDENASLAHGHHACSGSPSRPVPQRPWE
jgi:hypothetical protein